MARRLDLQDRLEVIQGSQEVYFQPPGNKQMVYPCIVYKQDSADTRFADNRPYTYTKRYMVTAISRDPDNPVADLIAAMPMCLFDRHYPANGLHHHVFNLYF